MPLDAERTLWLFGDTYFGEVRDGRRVNVQLVMGNSIAIQQGKDTQSARLRFFFGEGGGDKPAAFLRPRTSRGWFRFGHGLRAFEKSYRHPVSITTTKNC
ncbi:MAG: hypothetical protein ACP5RN_15425, partial [Armatimonadota bacterium]